MPLYYLADTRQTISVSLSTQQRNLEKCNENSCNDSQPIQFTVLSQTLLLVGRPEEEDITKESYQFPSSLIWKQG